MLQALWAAHPHDVTQVSNFSTLISVINWPLAPCNHTIKIPLSSPFQINLLFWGIFATSFKVIKKCPYFPLMHIPNACEWAIEDAVLPAKLFTLSSLKKQAYNSSDLLYATTSERPQSECHGHPMIIIQWCLSCISCQLGMMRRQCCITDLTRNFMVLWPNWNFNFICFTCTRNIILFGQQSRQSVIFAVFHSQKFLPQAC